MSDESWLLSTRQDWKLQAADAARWLGLALAILGTQVSAAGHDALGFSLSALGVAWGLLGSAILRVVIVCPTCGFRPYLHKPLLRGLALREARLCPRCGGRSTTALPPLEPTWTASSIGIALVAAWLLLFLLPELVIRRGLL